MPDIITRFAPSPTGALHLGGARTALFNFLFARHHQGRFVLRIEDTDKARSSDAHVASICEGLAWLGLNWDGQPVYQSQRAERHREIAEKLLKEGHAYRCFCTPEELDARREQARAQGRPLRYDRKCRNLPLPLPAPSNDRPFVIRIKAPTSGQIIIPDEVQGEIRFAQEEMDDFILLRSDGSPTYMLCVVVDDHDMNISHIIRGVDHLTNAARQAMIYQALDWQRPVFAHIPLIHGTDGAKLSKRHDADGAGDAEGAGDITTYRERGYLAEAMRNYLIRLGWAHGDDEIFSDDQAIKWFSLEGVGRSPARFDQAKLDSLNAHYLRQIKPDDLLEYILKKLKNEGLELKNSKDYQNFIPILSQLAERASTLTELAQNAKFLFIKEPFELSSQAQKLLTPQSLTILNRLIPYLEEIDWEQKTLEQTIRAFADEQGCSLKDVAQPMRVALTGQTKSPGIFDIMKALGRNETFARIKRI